MTIMAHKIRLTINNKQASFLNRCFGTSRWVYNQSLEMNQRMYAEGKKFPSKYNYRNLFIQEIKKNPVNAWLYEVPKSVTEYAVFNYHDAMKRFFKGQAKYPKYHKKGKARDSFTLGNDNIKIDGKRVRLPLIGWLRMRENVRFEGKIQSITVSRTADQYYISFTIDTIIEPSPQTGSMIGVDLNVASIVDSNDTHYPQPRSLERNLAKLKRLNKAFSRTQKGSRNRAKVRVKLARLHATITNQRADAHHKLSTNLVRDNSFIFTESLNVAGMLRNHKLARVIADSRFGEFLRQLSYKALNHERIITPVGRFYPSSKTCSECGTVRTKLSLSERVFTCDCGLITDRDYNAALNILIEGYRLLVEQFDRGLHGNNACGGVSAGQDNTILTKLAPLKQELNIKPLTSLNKF